MKLRFRILIGDIAPLTQPSGTWGEEACQQMLRVIEFDGAEIGIDGVQANG